MALLRICGFESGASGEVQTVGGTASIGTGTVRTGTYSLRCNPTTTATGYINIGKASAAGILGNFADVTLYTGFAFRAATLPAANSEPVYTNYGSLADLKAELRITSGGLLAHYNAAGTLVATGSNALSAGTWYYIEYMATNSATGAYEAKINGVSEFSGTSNNGTGNTVFTAHGKGTNRNGQTVDFFYDDIYVSNTGFKGSQYHIPEVRILLPNGAGASAGWTNGTGTTFAEADEVPPESDGADATYIQTTASDDTYHTFAVESTATKSVTGDVDGLAGYVWAKTLSTSGTNLVAPRIRNAGSNTDATQAEMTTGYRGHHVMAETDPATGTAWTLSGIDTAEIGMMCAAIAQAQRFSAAYIFVLARPDTTPSAAVTGTITPTATEADIVTGGKTIIITLTNDTWVTAGATFDAQRANIAAGVDSAQSEGTGWNAVVKAGIDVGDVVRTSDTVVTITLDAEATYNITATETITVTVPSTAVTGATEIVATPTFTVTAVGGTAVKDFISNTGFWAAPR